MIINDSTTGRTLKIENPDGFLGLDELKDHIFKFFGVAPQDQLLLVARTSAPLRLESVAEGQEVYLFDKQAYLKTSSIDERDVPRVQNKFESLEIDSSPPDDSHGRLLWAKRYLDSALWLVTEIQEIHDKISMIRQGLNIYIKYMAVHMRSVRDSAESRKDLAKKLEEDIQLTLAEWKNSYETLQNFKIFESGKKDGSLDKSKASASSDGSYSSSNSDLSPQTTAVTSTLQEQFDLKDLENNVQECKVAQQVLSEKLAKITSLAAQITNQFAEGSKRSIESFPMWNNRGFSDIAEDLQTVYDKLSEDTLFMETEEGKGHVDRLRQLHAQEFLANFPEGLTEIKSNYELACVSLSSARKIMNSMFSSASDDDRKKFKVLLSDLGGHLQKTEDIRVSIAQVIDAPYIYGLILLEKLHQNKWTENLRSICATLSEQYAEMRNQEIERRSNTWANVQIPSGLKHLISLDESQMSYMDLSLSNVQKYPVTQEMFGQHLRALQNNKLEEEFEDLQNRKSSQFDSNGSIIQFKTATLSQNAIVASYEQKIKGYELRVRKLEDILHRQHQMNVSHSGSVNLSPSVSSGSQPRLIERIHELEEAKKLTDEETLRLRTQGKQQFTQIEELESKISSHEKTIKELNEKLVAFEQEKAAQASSMESVESIKQDLLANLKAKEEDFVAERKSLGEEISQLKMKLEVTEEEADTSTLEITRLQGLLEEAVSSINEHADAQTRLQDRCRDLSQKLFTAYVRSNELLTTMGLQASKDEDGNYKINRVKGLRKGAEMPIKEPEPPDSLYWMNSDEAAEESNYDEFMRHLYIDHDLYRDAVGKRFGDVEHLARKLQKELRHIRSQQPASSDAVADEKGRFKVALNHFRVGDLALFLPTKEETKSPRPWAAFNIGAPHYFLKQKSSQNLQSREYLVARIVKIEERVVDKSKEDGEDTNPFDLSDGLKWHYLEVLE